MRSLALGHLYRMLEVGRALNDGTVGPELDYGQTNSKGRVFLKL